MKAHEHSVGSINTNGVQVPLIRLSGNWLKQQGFKIGRKFIVYETPGSLVLNLILPEDEKE